MYEPANLNFQFFLWQTTKLENLIFPKFPMYNTSMYIRYMCKFNYVLANFIDLHARQSLAWYNERCTTVLWKERRCNQAIHCPRRIYLPSRALPWRIWWSHGICFYIIVLKYRIPLHCGTSLDTSLVGSKLWPSNVAKGQGWRKGRGDLQWF